MSSLQCISNFGSFLFLLRFAKFLVYELHIDRKTFLCIFSAGFLFVLEI